MDEMVERVARAMYEIWYPCGMPPWGEAVISKETWRKSARAAIEAMREPTAAMQDAFRSWALPIGELDKGWNAAIDAALNSHSAPSGGQAFSKSSVPRP